MDELSTIASLGINAIRVPFGYWVSEIPLPSMCNRLAALPPPQHMFSPLVPLSGVFVCCQVVSGPSCGDPYVGPCLDQLDRVVSMGGELGLEVLLDLHGNPGGETDNKCCGRDRPEWTFEEWRKEEALEVLTTVARRYSLSAAVTAVQVRIHHTALSVGDHSRIDLPLFFPVADALCPCDDWHLPMKIPTV